MFTWFYQSFSRLWQLCWQCFQCWNILLSLNSVRSLILHFCVSINAIETLPHILRVYLITSSSISPYPPLTYIMHMMRMKKQHLFAADATHRWGSSFFIPTSDEIFLVVDVVVVSTLCWVFCCACFPPSSFDFSQASYIYER